MQCAMERCSGYLDESQWATMRTGRDSYARAWACSTCHRLHFTNGNMCTTRGGLDVFLEDKKVVYKNETGESVPI